jgi:hypothetical protein
MIGEVEVHTSKSGINEKWPIMNKSYCLPEIPSIYWVNYLRIECENCLAIFHDYQPNGNELVKFLEGKEERWLPTFTKGGYLYLLKKLLPDIDINKEISMKIYTEYIDKLQSHVKKMNADTNLILADMIQQCPKCGNTSLKTFDEKTLVNPELNWLEIDCELLNCEA